MSMYDAVALAQADDTTAKAMNDLLNGNSRPRGVVVSAPAGAGKSHLIADAAGRAVAAGMRVAVAAPTNEQAFGLVRTMSARFGLEVTFLPARDVALPPAIAAHPNVCVAEARDSEGAAVIVGTLDKLGWSFQDDERKGGAAGLRRDVLLIDESFQADSGRYLRVGDLAPLHLLVGDGGQISPFARIADQTRWRGLRCDPLQTAVSVLRGSHPKTPVHAFPVTRRLDARAVKVARHFYPGHHFRAAVAEGVRELALSGSASDRVDHAWDRAAKEGWARLTLPGVSGLRADRRTVALMADAVSGLLKRSPRVRCEREHEFGSLSQGRIAVGVTHNEQKDLVRVELESRGIRGVVVETANKLQGLEFDVTVVWHPLAGLAEADAFHLDPGRLCVLLTRHRHACVVVGRERDAELLEDDVPPAAEAFLGECVDTGRDGREIHRAVFAEWD